MSANYNGLTRNTWPGTWSPTAGHPIVLDTEIRGGLQSISGDVNDRLTDITGQRLQEGMVVYVKNSYIAGTTIRTGDKYYTYRSLAGEERNVATGALPNAEENWIEFAAGGGSTPTTNTLAVGVIDSNGTVSGTVADITSLQFDLTSGFSVTNLGNGSAKISVSQGMGSGLDADTVDGKDSSYFYSPTNKPVVIERYQFTDALQWIVTHNKGTDKFVETLTDSEGNRFFAKVHVIDLNTFAINLTSAISGTVDVLFTI